MGAVTFLPQVRPTVRRDLSLSCYSGRSMLSTCLSYRPRIHTRCFTVSAILYSGTQVNQTTKFVDTSKRENLTPLYQCIYADQLTPVLAYRCLVNENDHETPSFLFESVESEMETSTVQGRYSVIGANPAMEIIAKENSVMVMNHLEGWRTEEHSEKPITIAQRITEKFNPRHIDELPEMFCGGWVGYFPYDTVHQVDGRTLPDVYLGLYDDVLIFDHVEKKIYVIHWVQLDRFSSTEEGLNNGMDRLQSMLSKVYDIVSPRLPAGLIEPGTLKRHSKVELLSRESETYEAILKAKEQILAGDILQRTLSQQFMRRTFSDPFDVYRTLRVVNPSPFMGYLQVKGSILVASSQEILTHVEPKRKIVNGSHGGCEKGVRINGEKQFFNGEKHYKEQIVLPNLTNNDVRKVTDLNSTWWNALQTTLPVEALTGAPKIKSVELIDDLDVNKRGLYAGSIGSISFSGNMNIATAPKTIVFPAAENYESLLSYKNPNNHREWVAHIQAGATVVADSDPREAVRECKIEADTIALAIDLAESSFLH